MSTDIAWPTEFLELKRLDMLLKCGICYDYINTCMMTSCCHNYCSLCIRKSMQYKTQCPTCFEETYEGGLRNNRPLDEIILVYMKIRDRLMRALRVASAATSPIPITPSHINIKTNLTPLEPLVKTPTNLLHSINSSSLPVATSGFKDRPKENGTTSGGKNNNQSMSHHSKKKNISCSLFPPVIPNNHSTNNGGNPSETSIIPEEEREMVTRFVPQMFLSPKKKSESSLSPHRVTSSSSGGAAAPSIELSVCPVCDVQIPTRNINIHLDACLSRNQETEEPKPKLNKVSKREPLPKRLYNLMSDKDLKKSLKEFGLSIQGDRKAFIHRLQRFTVLYNSENDTDRPRPITELLLQVEREEREEKKPTASIMMSFQRMTVDRKAPIEVIEKVNKKYIDENKESFKMLIENMRQREGRNIRPTKPAQRIESDDDDNSTEILQDPQPSTSSSSSGTSSVDKKNTLEEENTQYCSTLLVDRNNQQQPKQKIHGKQFMRKMNKKLYEKNPHQIDWNKRLCLKQVEELEEDSNNSKTNNEDDGSKQEKIDYHPIGLNEIIELDEDEELGLKKDSGGSGPSHCGTSGVVSGQEQEEEDGAFYSSVFDDKTGAENNESSSDSVFEFTNGSSSKKRGSLASSTPHCSDNSNKRRRTPFRATSIQNGNERNECKIAPLDPAIASPQMFSDSDCQDVDLDTSLNQTLGDVVGEEMGTPIKRAIDMDKSESEGVVVARRRKRKTVEDITGMENEPSLVENDEETQVRRRSLRKRIKNTKYNGAS